MKKKIPLLLALMLSAASFAACGGNKDQDHEHTFSDKYAQTQTHHWFAATCEHGEEKQGYGEHTDANEDGLCDVCAYETGHTHTFSESWSKDETNHWHAATCTHSTEKSDNELHTDANEDGKCDVCEGHVHVVNDAGYCDLCNTQVTPIETSIASIINATIAQSKNVLGGEVDYTFNSVTQSLEDENGKHPFAQMTSNTTYKLGNGATYVERTSNSTVYNLSDMGEWNLGQETDLSKVWFYMDKGEVRGFQEYTYKGVMTPSFVSADEDSLSGYYFAVSTLAHGYGAETILFNLYTLSQEESASDYVEMHDETKNLVTFKFNSLIINTDTAAGEDDSVRYFETSVSFTYSEAYELTSLNILCDAYTNDAGTNTGEADVDYDYDQESKTITMRQNASPDTYTFTVSQDVGERTYVHDKDISKYMPKSFNFDVANGSKLTYDVMDDIEIKFEADPITSFDIAREFIDAKLVCTNGDSSSYAFIFIDDNNEKSIFISGIMAGEYVLNFLYNDETIWSVDISVTAPIVVGEYVSVVVDDNNTFDGQLVSFEAPASGTYTFHIPAGFGAVDKDEWDFGGFDVSLYVDPNFNQEGDSFSVDIAQGDVYEFYISAPSKGTHILTYTFEEKEVVSGGDNDDNNDVDYTTVLNVGENTLYFSAEELAADTATRFLIIVDDNPYKFSSSNLFVSSITDSNNNPISKNEDYTFTLTTGVYEVTFSMLSMFGVHADVACSLNIKSMGVVVPTPVGFLEEEAENVVSVSNDDINNPGYILYTFIPYNDGEYRFTADFDCIIIDEENNVLGTNSAVLELYTSYVIKLDVSNLYLGGEYVVEIHWIPPMGSQENPFVLTQLGDFVAAYAVWANPVWHVYTPAEDGSLTISTTHAAATLLCGAAFGFEQSNLLPGESLTISVVGGIPYYIGVIDYETWTDVSIPFSVTFTAGEVVRDGSRNAPLTLTLGETVCNLVNEEPTWGLLTYVYTATADGKLTASTVSENFNFNFSDTLHSWMENTDNSTVSINVVAGQKVYLFVTTADMNDGQIAINVVFEELQIIDVTTLEGDGSFTTPYILTGAGQYDMGLINAYPGAYVSIVAEETMQVTLSADVAQLYNSGWALLANPSIPYTITIDQGTTFTFIVCMDQGEAEVVLSVEVL